MKFANLQVLNSIILIGLIVFFVFTPIEKPIYPTSTIKELQTIVNDTTIHLTTIKNRIEKVDLKPLEDRIDSLLNIRLNSVDTVVIIRVQDTIIIEQSKVIDTLKKVVINKDSVINIYEFTSDVKDSIINLQKIKVKKQRRNMLKLTITSIALGFISIVK